MACSYSILPLFFDLTVVQEEPEAMKKSTDENREFDRSLGSGEKGQGSSQHQGRSGYAKDTSFVSKYSLYCHSVTPPKLSG